MPTNDVKNLELNHFNSCFSRHFKRFFVSLYHQVYSSYTIIDSHIKFTYGFSIGKPITILIMYDKDPNFNLNCKILYSFVKHLTSHHYGPHFAGLQTKWKEPIYNKKSSTQGNIKEIKLK